MPRSNRILFIFTLLALIPFTLAACGSGGGYSENQWEYKGTTHSAEAPPKSLSDDYSSNEQKIYSSPQSNQGPITPQQAAQQQPVMQPGNQPSVKVAILLPLSGKHKALGSSMLKAAQLALFDIGFNDFELIPQDTQGTPQGAKDAARMALDNGAQLILGPLFADSVRAVKPIARTKRVNVIAFSTDWSIAGDNAFIMGFLPFDQVERITAYLADNNVQPVGILTPDTAYGRAVGQAYTQIAGQYGINTSARKSFPANSSNLSGVIREFSQYDSRQTSTSETLPPPFSAVLMPVGGQQAEAIANLLSHYDLPPRQVKRVGTGLFDDRSLAGETNLNGAWFAAPSPRLRSEFEKKYIATYGQSSPRLATLAYDATALAAILGMRGMEANNAPAFDKTSISNPNGFSGIDGIFRFRPNGTAERGLAILEFQRGRIVEIEPAPSTFQQQKY